MKNDPTSKPAVETRAAKRMRYVIEKLPDSWIAHDKDNPASGFLLFNKLTGTYHAWSSEMITQYPQLARGKFQTPDDCPVDKSHLPKADLLMLLAIRHRFKERAPGSQWMAFCAREHAFAQRSYELKQKTGKIISERNWKCAMDIAKDEFKFEKYAGEWLVSLVQDDRAGDILIRFGTWLKRVSQIESETIETHYQRFFDAVAAAATATGGIPTQKAVRPIYEKGRSANELGEGTGFRSTMRQLQFDWLPPGGRGPGRPKISGIKSRN